MQKFGTRTELLKTEQTPVESSGYQGTIVVLVNKGTANSAELLAAVLHDRRGCRIVGASTFGDAMAQTIFPLSDGSAFTLTTGVLKTDIGRPFNISGLVPDVPLRDAGIADQPNDPGLDRAVALLSLGPLTADQARSLTKPS
jgi:carboxyl-terminal processing protease